MSLLALRFSVLDLRLGGRMLVKHPALTVIACAIAGVVPTRWALRIQPMEALKDER